MINSAHQTSALWDLNVGSRDRAFDGRVLARGSRECGAATGYSRIVRKQIAGAAKCPWPVGLFIRLFVRTTAGLRLVASAQSCRFAKPSANHRTKHLEITNPVRRAASPLPTYRDL